MISLRQKVNIRPPVNVMPAKIRNSVVMPRLSMRALVATDMNRTPDQMERLAREKPASVWTTLET